MATHVDKLTAPPSFTIEYVIKHKVDTVDADAASTSSAVDTSMSSTTEPGAETPAREPVTPSGPGVDFATPPSHDSNLDPASVGPHRYRSITNLYNTTLQTEEEETLGLIAAEEPASLEAVLYNPAWRGAMEVDLKSIEDNATWSLL
jgi:hypothetical protein